jgi:hypothetical protein
VPNRRAAIWRPISADLVRINVRASRQRRRPRLVPQAAAWLVGFTMNSAATTPRKSLSAGRRMLRSKGRRFEGWTAAMRERVAEQVTRIRHWQIIEGDYSLAPDPLATWFIDPPYQGAGKYYVHGSAGLDYGKLAKWCLARRGQPIVCEQPGAVWLPFRRIGVFKSGPSSVRAAEAVWP